MCWELLKDHAIQSSVIPVNSEDYFCGVRSCSVSPAVILASLVNSYPYDRQVVVVPPPPGPGKETQRSLKGTKTQRDRKSAPAVKCFCPNMRTWVQIPRTNIKSQTWLHAPTSPALGRQRQEDPRGLLVSQSSQSQVQSEIVSQKINWRETVSENKLEGNPGRHPVLTSDFYTFTHAPVYTPHGN